MDKYFRIRLSIAFFLIAALGVGVAVRAAYLMLMPSKRLSTAMERQFRKAPPKEPRRGHILDRNNEPLAVSVAVKSLFANPDQIENKKQVAAWIGKSLNMSVAKIQEKLEQDKSFVWIKRQLTQEEEEGMQKTFSRYPVLVQSLGLVKESKRFYPNQTLASQLMGFTGLDSKGLEGLEFSYNKELAGISSSTNFREGKTLVLTIDKSLQHTLEDELESGIKKTNAKGGTAIVMDADNGDILAMASYPSYNPNHIRKGGASFRGNRSVTDLYEPGSTMKPILLAGALEWKAVTKKTKVFCEYGKMKIGNRWINEAEVKDKWGWLSVGEVLQKSSNVGATKIGFLFGPQNIYKWYKHMGMQQRTNIDVAGEVVGSLSAPETWSKITQSNISFGQGLSVTPIQMLRAYAAFTNEGYLVEPRLVQKALNAEGELLQEFPIGKKEKVLSAKTAWDISEMMAGVTTADGTAVKAAIPGFTVAGKTGTAQKAIPGIGYRSGKYIASFIGYVRDVKPNYIGFVMVDEPAFPYFGGEAAAPIFQKIMTAALARAGIAPKEYIEPKMPLGLGEKQKSNKTKLATAMVLKESGLGWTMPNLMGASAREVLDVFHRQDVVLKIHGSGTVVEQIPIPGAAFKKGESVSIRLDRSADIP